MIRESLRCACAAARSRGRLVRCRKARSWPARPARDALAHSKERRSLWHSRYPCNWRSDGRQERLRRGRRGIEDSRKVRTCFAQLCVQASAPLLAPVAVVENRQFTTAMVWNKGTSGTSPEGGEGNQISNLGERLTKKFATNRSRRINRVAARGTKQCRGI